jgi:predicted transcriptional regulator
VRIHQRFLAGETIPRIAQDLTIDRETVRKYAAREDSTVKPPLACRAGFPSLEEYVRTQGQGKVTPFALSAVELSD